MSALTADDRAKFESDRQRNCLALGRDQSAFDQAAAALTTADKHSYAYLWSWWGLPIIQMPADIMATQEVVFATKPTVIIETGVARGGSLVFMASLLQLLGRGKVIGIDIDIRPHNRDSIERHPMSHRIELIQGSSTDPSVLEQVRRLIGPEDSVMVVLDSDHSKSHVLAELRAYGPLVTKDQYMIVADTLLGQIDADKTPEKRSKIWRPGDEPFAAVKDYLGESDRFETDLVLNGKLIFASSPGGYLRCRG
ncbi:cephalosporin hydroxylase family protein [Bosea vaviloviae]|uniref:Cephalosporin hydroxylase n=1 Tax=Bosea vaviloviae TaxID=1526658 RepID=A0A1D7TZ39_9HYPH|nr:CmcI family methyltransferase [Bosea vaviloviae]AOO80386.1 cephalosporin hydroxylase [Bosea vaviloviae]